MRVARGQLERVSQSQRTIAASRLHRVTYRKAYPRLFSFIRRRSASTSADGPLRGGSIWCGRFSLAMKAGTLAVLPVLPPRAVRGRCGCADAGLCGGRGGGAGTRDGGGDAGGGRAAASSITTASSQSAAAAAEAAAAACCSRCCTDVASRRVTAALSSALIACRGDEERSSVRAMQRRGCASGR